MDPLRVYAELRAAAPDLEALERVVFDLPLYGKRKTRTVGARPERLAAASGLDKERVTDLCLALCRCGIAKGREDGWRFDPARLRDLQRAVCTLPQIASYRRLSGALRPGGVSASRRRIGSAA